MSATVATLGTAVLEPASSFGSLQGVLHLHDATLQTRTEALYLNPTQYVAVTEAEALGHPPNTLTTHAGWLSTSPLCLCQSTGLLSA